jgi:hypothetical protein
MGTENRTSVLIKPTYRPDIGYVVIRFWYAHGPCVSRPRKTLPGLGRWVLATSYDGKNIDVDFFLCTENKTFDSGIDPDENTRLGNYYRLVVS